MLVESYQSGIRAFDVGYGNNNDGFESKKVEKDLVEMGQSIEVLRCFVKDQKTYITTESWEGICSGRFGFSSGSSGLGGGTFFQIIHSE